MDTQASTVVAVLTGITIAATELSNRNITGGMYLSLETADKYY